MMTKIQRPITTLAMAALVFSAGTASRSLHAAEVVMPTVPLIVSIDAVPNVWFQLDDSGSMDWELLAGDHVTSCRYNSLAQCSTLFPSTDGLMQIWSGRWDDDDANPELTNLAYVFDLGDSDHRYDSDCPGGGNGGSWGDCYDDYGTSGDREEDSKDRDYPIDRDWRVRSAALNVLYFNPNNNYQPWPDSDDYTFSNASFSAARSWPVSGETGYDNTFNLGGDDDDGAFFYHVWVDDRGWDSDVNPLPQANPPNMTIGGNGVVDQWDSHVKVTIGASNVTCEKISYDPKSYSWPDSLEGINPTSTAISCDGYKAGLTDSVLRQRAANWFQYFRRRTHVARAAVAQVASELPNYRYGTSSINQTGSTYEIPSEEILDYEQNTRQMMDVIYNTNRVSRGTPLRRGLERVGRIFQGAEDGIDSPINLTCQKNFAILFSDGFWNGGNPTVPAATPDWDGDNQNIGGNGVTVADVAAYFYDTDLRTDLDDAVPTDTFDTANWQHLVTYTVAFGLSGTLEDTNGDGWPNPPLDRADDWYLNGNQLDRVEDMWHAAWNAKGRFFAAQRPEDLFNDVRDALEDIGARIGGAASAAANSGSISSTSRIFQAKFDSADWHGELLSFPVNNDGTLGSVAVWDANDILNNLSNADRTGRKIWTSTNGSGKNWDDLSGAQYDLLGFDSAGVEDGRSADRLRYIKGDNTLEESRGGDFRSRENYLGDIVNSDPTFVGFPPFFYPFDNYQSFFSAQYSRPGMIYVGANDGMLHAFVEETGEELFAYIPDAVIKNLPDLTDPDYAHTFYVDGAPSYGDVFYGGSWKSVLSGALRSGGQAVYALDVTDPTAFDATDVLWEFNDQVDADLGYVWGEPQIKKMQNGQWAVIVGNGLNNTASDGYASTTGAGALFILYIEPGVNGWSLGDWKKITVPGGSVVDPNGLFTPAAADIDGDSLVDFVYAGDINGNMWKFDLRTESDSGWKLDFGGDPLFTDPNGSAISDRPAIAPHPQGRNLGQLVLFGTGKFIELSDNETVGQPTQAIYALWDFDKSYQTSKSLTNDFVSSHTKAELSQNSYSTRNGGDVRVIESGTKVSWLDGNNDPNNKGWYMDLPIEGERMTRRPVLRDNLAFFVTLTPDPDPCAAGGTGYISVLDISTGLAPTFPVFDIDGDLDVGNEGDTIEAGDPDDDSDNLVPVGIKSPSIPNLPALIYDDRPGFDSSVPQFPMEMNSVRGCDSGSARAYTFTTGSNGSILAIETATEALSCGRQNWRGER